jgi:hypothetical protein
MTVRSKSVPRFKARRCETMKLPGLRAYQSGECPDSSAMESQTSQTCETQNLNLGRDQHGGARHENELIAAYRPPGWRLSSRQQTKETAHDAVVSQFREQSPPSRPSQVSARREIASRRPPMERVRIEYITMGFPTTLRRCRCRESWRSTKVSVITSGFECEMTAFNSIAC